MVSQATTDRSSSRGQAEFARRSMGSGKPLAPVRLARIASWRVPTWWLTEYFGPLESFAKRLQEEGTVDVSACGIPLHSLPDGTLYFPVAEMWAMAEVFRIARLRDASCPNSEVLLRVASKLNTEQLLTLDDVIELRRCLQELQGFAAQQSRGGMTDLIRTARIKLEMGKREMKPIPVIANRLRGACRLAPVDTFEKHRELCGA